MVTRPQENNKSNISKFYTRKTSNNTFNYKQLVMFINNISNERKCRIFFVRKKREFFKIVKINPPTNQRAVIIYFQIL